MVTLGLLVTGKGAYPKAFGMLVMISFLMLVHVTQVCSPPNILNCHLGLYMFFHVCYFNKKEKSYVKDEIPCSL